MRSFVAVVLESIYLCISYRVNAYIYSLSGGGSIDWVPGVVLAAWGGPGRALGAVRQGRAENKELYNE